MMHAEVLFDLIKGRLAHMAALLRVKRRREDPSPTDLSESVQNMALPTACVRSISAHVLPCSRRGPATKTQQSRRCTCLAESSAGHTRTQAMQVPFVENQF